MNHSDIAVLMKGAAPAIRDFIASSMQPLVARIGELERELAEVRGVDHSALIARAVADAVAELPPSAPGKDADPEVVRAMVDAAVSALPPPAPGKDADPEFVRQVVAEAVAAIPAPRDGKDADPDIIRAMVGEAVAALPPAQPGKDADPDLIADMVHAEVARAVAAIPAPADGKSVTLDELAPMVDDAVAKAVAAIPAPKDGRSVTEADIVPLIEVRLPAAIAEAVKGIPAPKDGESVDPLDVERLVQDTVQRVLDGWEKPKDGASVTIDDVAPLIDDAVSKAVAALPPPEKGDTGAPGRLPVVKAWSDEIAYEGEVRAHAGATWQATKDTAKEPPHADWICLAAPGEPGTPARQIEVRGTYASDGDYQALNIVALNGGAFIARKDNPGPCPGEGWQVIAMRGKPGEPGKPGPAMKGPPGPAPLAMHIDEHGLLTLVNGDGSTVECDFYPLLSKIGRA